MTDPYLDPLDVDPLDDTQPTRPPDWEAVQHHVQADVQPGPYVDYDDESTGPGCIVWGALGFFMVLLAGAIVFLAGYAGWSDGLKVAYGNATAQAQDEIDRQCGLISGDLQQGNLGLAQQRFLSLEQVTPVPACVATFAPTATARYLELQPTETPTSTPTEALIEATPTVEAEVTEAVVDAEPTSDSPYDLAGMLSDAEALMADGEIMEAIEWLEAIQSIDGTYQKARIDQMLFNAYISEADRNYRQPNGSLAEAIALTDRAEAYGDVGEYAFEREVAQLYLNAQTYIGVDYGRAIQALNSVRNLAPNYKDTGTLLFNQYVAYGDALVASFSPCEAVNQYENALRMQNNANVGGKRDAARTSCELGTSGTGTPGLGQSGDSGTPIAPIGVPNT
ncbi:hypothetical protein G4Y79_09140 [Phototrophicus methaneseepsis]|uniref:Tetratricopeptide repeat protein n=1 Tax=Phototrophicus methaneseepsis TaxID=2710758 RepID=A0A7S8ECQ1_9CHLR|nr:hypothetical protein [Phototrophicus methaneseepsis]QPC84521.1 hypothetical protein G4Y79_09140 [Phototrophicus methaneseepsis]